MATVGFAALAVWASWPLVGHISAELPAPLTQGAWMRADLDLLVWILNWTARTIVVDPLSLFDANLFHPIGNSLARSEHLIGLTPIASPVLMATGNPILTYNLTALVMATLTALGLRFALLEEKTIPLAAFIVPALFAFDPGITRGWVRLHESAIWLFPVVVALGLRVARRPGAGSFLLLVGASALQFLAGAYLSFALLALLLPLFPVFALEARRHGNPFWRPLAGVALGLLLAGPSALPYLARPELVNLGESTGVLGPGRVYALPALSPTAVSGILLDGCGLVLVPLALLGVLVGDCPRSLRIGLLASALLGALLALGPQGYVSIPNVYLFLMEWLPGFSAMRSPARFLFVSRIAMALLAGVGLSVLLGPMGARARGVVVLCASLILAWAAGPAPLELTGPLRSPYTIGAHRWIGQQGEPGAVLDLPVPTRPGQRAGETGRAMLGSIEHWQPLINGYSGSAPSSHWLLMTLASRLPDPTAFEALCRHTNLRWIVTHFGLMDTTREGFEKSGLPIRERARFGRDVVWEVMQPCGQGTDALRAQVAEPGPTSLGGVAVLELGPSGRLADLEVEGAEGGRFSAGKSVRVTIGNLGEQPWPGLDVERKGRVELVMRFWDPDLGVGREGFSLPLGRDLAPGETLDLDLAFSRWELRPGREVELGIRQRGYGWFVDRGGRGSVRFRVPERGAAEPAAAEVRHAP